jgi:hypothetical protein
MGNFSVSSSMAMKEAVTRGVPVAGDTTGSLEPATDLWMGPPGPGDLFYAEDELGAGFRDEKETDLTWNASVNYQQRLVGSTTLTPSLRISGRMLRRDTLGSSFFSAPSRLSFGASLKTDIYGFFPGVASFEAIRHKITPSVDFSYSPEVTPTELQDSIFGSREIRTLREVRFSINQTFEAKLKPREPEAAEPAGEPTGESGDSLQAEEAMEPGVLGEEGLIPADSLAADSAQGPRQAAEQQKVTLLALRTSAVTYDFEEADETGQWLQGFQTTRLSNNLSSDFLRGLTISFSHDLFEEEVIPGEGGTSGGESTRKRKFSPHLSQMNFSFSLNGQSALVRALGRLLGRADSDEPIVEVSAEEEMEEEDPFATDPLDEARVVPGATELREVGRGGPRRSSGRVGDWRANFSFSLQRPRNEELPSNQMLQSSLSFQPTEKWEASWRTSYDIVNKSFNDHLIRLTRDLHRWEAHFDFRQTATGNWSFRFEVALTDNDDLHFDYQQRSIQDASGIRRF